VRCQLDVLVEKLGLSVEELVENAWVHKAQEHLPLDDLATPYDAAQDFIEACAAETRRTLTPTPDPHPNPIPNLTSHLSPSPSPFTTHHSPSPFTPHQAAAEMSASGGGAPLTSELRTPERALAAAREPF